jgi:hypothetical protein
MFGLNRRARKEAGYYQLVATNNKATAPTNTIMTANSKNPDEDISERRLVPSGCIAITSSPIFRCFGPATGGSTFSSLSHLASLNGTAGARRGAV